MVDERPNMWLPYLLRDQCHYDHRPVYSLYNRMALLSLRVQMGSMGRLYSSPQDCYGYTIGAVIIQGS